MFKENVIHATAELTLILKDGEEHAAENVRKVIETALIQNGFDDVRIEECKVFLVESSDNVEKEGENA